MEEPTSPEPNTENEQNEQTISNEQNIVTEEEDNQPSQLNTEVDIETKKENFRKYLTDKGVMELLTKMLVGLYETNDRPTDPEASFEYCRSYFSKLEGVDINVIKAEIERNKEKLKELNNTFDELNRELNGTDQQ